MPTTPNAIVTDNVRRMYAKHVPDGKPVSQKEFANALGVSQETVSRYLRGRARWTIDAMTAWAGVFGTTVEHLIHEHPES